MPSCRDGSLGQAGTEKGEAMNYAKPEKTIVTLELARAWPGELCCIQIKADGEFKTHELGAFRTSVLVAGEWVTRKSGGFLTAIQSAALDLHPCGIFVAFDVLEWDGSDISFQATLDRWNLLVACSKCFPSNWLLIESLASGKDVEAAMQARAEGCVAKMWNAPYGSMFCVKKLQTHLCTVTGMGGSQSVGIAELVAGVLVDRGRVTLRGGKTDKVRVGSIIKVEGMGLTDTSKIREPRLCQDTPTSWLVKF